MDIELDRNGDIYEQTRYVTGPEAVLQRVQIRLNTFQGEYVLDERVGIPWLRWLSQKERLDDVAQTLRYEMETTPGIQRVLEFAPTRDGNKIEITGRLVLEDPNQPGIPFRTETDTTDGTTRVVSL